MTRTGHGASLLVGALIVGCLVGCFVDEGASSDGAADASASTGETSDLTTGAATAVTGTEATGSVTAGDDSTGDAQTGTCGFLCGETGEPGAACNVFAQDCAQGLKCAPYSSDGDATHDAVKCVPVSGAGKPGEPCKGDGVASGLDDCEAGALCWDPYQQGDGVCVALCQGSHAAPVCPDASATHCSMFESSVLELCLPTCDPLVQDCVGEDLCVFMSEEFVCVYDASGPNGGVVFDPCERVNGCDKGLACLNPPLASECAQNAPGCCLPLCSLADDTLCPGAGQSCVPFYAEGMAPPGNEDVGACIIPD